MKKQPSAAVLYQSRQEKTKKARETLVNESGGCLKETKTLSQLTDEIRKEIQAVNLMSKGRKKGPKKLFK